MNNRHKQQGMTAIGWMGVLAIIALVTLFTLRLIPVYLDSFKVNSVLESVEKEYSDKDITPIEITKTIMKRLDINMVTDITKDDIYITRDGKTLLVEIDYEVRKSLMGNVDLIVHFQKSMTLQLQ
ncbi:MAG: DUF4845 domain-containing protein [Gammaproteobacteria bacterium]|nr:DUF4845 domain-containing protein [Gammaproteobacteria bacterium]